MASFFDFSKVFILIVLITVMGAVAVTSDLENHEFLRKELLIISIIIVLIIGILRFNQVNLSKNNLDQFIGREVILTGYIDNEPEVDGNKMRFVFSAEGGSTSGGKVNKERVLVATNAFPKRGFGDQLEIRGKLELPVNFSEFDYITYLKKDGIRTIIFYPKDIEKTDVALGLRDKLRVMIYHNIFVFKNKFQNAIDLSVSEPNASFINGILLGTRQNIPEGLKEAFNKTGTTHILAISGYNIMIISWAILEGLIIFFRRRIAFWISVVAIILFVILTGASASVVRAAVMGLFLSFAHGYGRLYDQKNSIILAGAVMIYHNPLILVFDIGFQLSFAAVLGLIYLYPWLDNKLFRIPKFSGVKELILMTISAQIAVAPFLVYYFSNFSFISLPANLLILPFLPYAMLSGFVTGLAGIIFLPLGQLLGYIAWAITVYQIWVVEFFARMF